MVVHAQQNNAISLTIDAVEYKCQVVDLAFTLPGYAAATLVETACADGQVSEPGARQTGSLTGNVYTDTRDTGITYALAQAVETGELLPYVLTLYGDDAATRATQGMIFTGWCEVNQLTIDWSKPGMGKHAIDLAIASAVLTRPVA